VSRPLGEVRHSIGVALRDLEARQGSASWIELAHYAQVGRAAAKTTVQNMIRAGEIEVCGLRRYAHARRPMVLVRYVDKSAGDPVAALGAALQAWHR
jgi:hypothetical protein